MFVYKNGQMRFTCSYFESLDIHIYILSLNLNYFNQPHLRSYLSDYFKCTFESRVTVCHSGHTLPDYLDDIIFMWIISSSKQGTPETCDTRKNVCSAFIIFYSTIQIYKYSHNLNLLQFKINCLCFNTFLTYNIA